uniref:Uncharacterized protein n=1 Tax=Glossina brevipalpis TaxID=37001 RepID=A0A1A9W585_9MUSC
MASNADVARNLIVVAVKNIKLLYPAFLRYCRQVSIPYSRHRMPLLLIPALPTATPAPDY